MKTYAVIAKLIRDRLGLFFVNLLLWTSIGLMELIPGILIKWFFDMLTGSAPARLNEWTLVTLVLLTAVFHILFIGGGALIDVRYRFSIGTMLRRNILNKILHLPGALALAGSSGESISTFRDDVEVVEETTSWINDQVGLVVYAIVALVIMLQINIKITLLATIPLISVIVIARLAQSAVKRYRDASREATSGVTGFVGEMLNAVQAIQLAGAENRIAAHFQKLNNDRRQFMVKDRLLTQFLNSIFSHAGTLSISLILILASQAMQTSDFSVGDFALFVSYLAVFTKFTTNFGGFLTQYEQTKVSLKRMIDLVQDRDLHSLMENSPLPPDPVARPELSAARDDTHPLLEVRRLTARYPQSDAANPQRACIENISFQLHRGDLVVITGRVGSGKTTLLRTVLGLLPKDSGEVRWNGELVEDPATFFAPPRCAYTGQIPYLFSGSLRENILMGLAEKDVDLPSAIRSAVMERDVNELEKGLDTLVGPRGVKLSGGQAQRTVAARMFVRNPDLLIFDDLSSALDVETERILWERLFERKNVTSLVVSHRKPVLRRAKRIIVLKGGKIEAIGELDTLMKTCEEMQRLWESQMEG